MIQINNLKLAFFEQIIFKDISVHIKRDDRIGLVGPNGAGKTTLFRSITGLQVPDAGNIRIAKDFTIGYLPQETQAMHGKTVLAETLSVFSEAMELEKQIAELQTQAGELMAGHSDTDILNRLGKMQHRFEELGGYRLEAESKRILTGLGFQESDLLKPIEKLSGGWQMRVALARLLASKPSLLLLDEPTNHLDIRSMEWLEEYLQNYQGAVILISHDRFFLDRVVKKIWQLERGVITEYVGNYSFFESEKRKNEERLELEYERQKEEIARIQKFIERFRYKATKAAQVQSRIKMLEKMERIIPPQDSRHIYFRFPPAIKSGRVVVALEDIGMNYGDRPVFSGVSFHIERGERVALVGENGSGKSTLSRILNSRQKPSSGQIEFGHNVTIGFYSQEVADDMNSEATVLEELEKAAGTREQTRLRTLLGAFLFSGDDVFKRVSVLSGGEKSRLALAKILVQPANFLILDEPTNHLDLQAKDMLRSALMNFEGTLVLVSHDRYFLDKIVNRLFEINRGVVKEYLGNYSYYLEKRQQEQLAIEPMMVEELAKSSKKSKEQKRKEAEERNRLAQQRRPIAEKLTAIESEIADLEKIKLELETDMANPETFKEEQKARKVNNDYREVNEKLAELYEQWELVSQSIENLLV